MNYKVQEFLKPLWIWIKQYRHPLRMFGGVFFVLALLAGIFWIAGKDIEPIAFTFGLFSSFFLASPSIAEYFLPERKPVREMSFEEILEFIPTTDSESDWNGISREWSSERFLREDPRLRFRAKYTDDGVQRKDYIEEWANKFPDKRATSYWYDLFYDGAFLDRFILVSVDGAKADIPPPDLGNMSITRLAYQVAKIHDTLDNLDEYLARMKITIKE